MGLVQGLRYETDIKGRDITPEVVLSMLRDVRAEIGMIGGSFRQSKLTRVLSIVEDGSYEFQGAQGAARTHVNLSAAKKIIDTYRELSEGGCKSCTSLGRETVNAQDGTSGWYCRDSDPDFDENAVGDQQGVRMSGFSPKVGRHYQKPCDVWDPKLKPKLEVLIKNEK